MRSVITLLVLLLPMCGSLTLGTQTDLHTESQSTGAAAAAAAVSTQVDMYAELRELRDMVDKQGITLVEQRMTLSFTQDELKNTNDLLNKIVGENDAVKQRLVASETKVEALERVNLAQEAELTAVKTRLAASETEVVNLKKEAAAQTADLRSVTERLVATETDMEYVKKDTAAQEAELTVVKTRLAATETEVVNLEKEITEKPKVAFSAGLTNSGYIESGNTELNLVFTKTITNVGQAYSNMTGLFTAPVKGVYYFRFTVIDRLSSRSMFIKMIKNGEQVMQLYDYDTDGQVSYLSSGVTLQLEVGDVVNMRIPAGYRLYDHSDNYSTFSGFLLFTL
ncbi:uncharacterized protein LOC122132437 [Clupea harengus]|uniref:Uncharacterized protein LOC122132437 n=1 Tax=Clupea harengus TaxID=7950 RepID=A0A8M1KL63_CLUHA|nr:uncharacterized protein LOC122132437 [Clupea harengus]